MDMMLFPQRSDMSVSPLMWGPETFLGKGGILTKPYSLISCLHLRHLDFMVFYLPGFQFPKHKGYWALSFKRAVGPWTSRKSFKAVAVHACLVTQMCLTFCDPMDCSLPGSSVHGILQARILEWVAMPSSWGSSQPTDRTQVSCIAGEFLAIWATREAQDGGHQNPNLPSNCSKIMGKGSLEVPLPETLYHLFM